MEENVAILYCGKIYTCPVTLGNVGMLYPRDFKVYYMHNMDINGQRKPFVVIYYYNYQNRFVECVPYFNEYLVKQIQHFKDTGQQILPPQEFYLGQYFRYVTVEIPYEVCCLYNYTDLFRENLNMDYLYKPKMVNGSPIKTNKITCLQKLVRDNETGEISPDSGSSLTEVFHKTKDYCYEEECDLGKRRKLFELGM